MKCVKTRDGKILRLPDFQAKALIEAGAAFFVPKSEWKKDTAPLAKTSPRPATRGEKA
jgi:hypothetical protein